MRETYPNELYHHGILGQRWGIRRYQDKDGSLTAAGRKRYRKEKNAPASKYSNILSETEAERTILEATAGRKEPDPDQKIYQQLSVQELEEYARKLGAEKRIKDYYKKTTKSEEAWAKLKEAGKDIAIVAGIAGSGMMILKNLNGTKDEFSKISGALSNMVLNSKMFNFKF